MEILNREEPQSMGVFQEGDLLEIDCSIPKEDKIRRAIAKMKNNKAAGCNGIPGEFFKVGIEENTKIMAKLFEKVWVEERVPAEWLKGNICKLPKKGGPQRLIIGAV